MDMNSFDGRISGVLFCRNRARLSCIFCDRLHIPIVTLRGRDVRCLPVFVVGGRAFLCKIDVYSLAGVKPQAQDCLISLFYLEGAREMFLRISVATDTRQNLRQKWSVELVGVLITCAKMSQFPSNKNLKEGSSYCQFQAWWNIGSITKIYSLKWKGMVPCATVQQSAQLYTTKPPRMSEAIPSIL